MHYCKRHYKPQEKSRKRKKLRIGASGRTQSAREKKLRIVLPQVAVQAAREKSHSKKALYCTTANGSASRKIKVAAEKTLHRRRSGVKSYQKKLDKAEIDVIVKA